MCFDISNEDLATAEPTIAPSTGTGITACPIAEPMAAIPASTLNEHAASA